MNVLFDTSVLVAALIAQHPAHSVCLPWLLRAQSKESQGLISTHTLAELYSALTRIPYRPRLSPLQAQTLIIENLKTFERISLEANDYDRAIDLMVSLGLPGGGIFDALIAQAASKTTVDVLLTLNPKHFVRLSEEIANLVNVPS